MIKIINNKHNMKNIINMIDMKPLQIGRLINPGMSDDNHIVMRTALLRQLEVINLTNPGQDKCWTGHNTLKVKLLEPEEIITLQLYNE